MFWKRKDKRKSDGEAGGSAAATADPPQGHTPGDSDDTPEAEAGADDATGETSKTGTGEDADAAGDTDAAQDPQDAEAGTGRADSDGIQRVTTDGVLRLDNVEHDTSSHTWIVEADDDGVLVIDPAHDSQAILDAVGDREIYLVACTNGYNTHISAAVEVAERDDAPIALHRRELRAWRRTHGAEYRPDHEIEGGGSFTVGDLEVDILPVPGTSAGSVAYYVPERGAVFSGDTLRAGEPGTVGGGYLDYTGQLSSIGEVLLTLPPDTRVLPDNGPETTVEAETRNFDAWVSPG
ncbi:glyoxylase-like metal-dependent hydrolase (beta-lactamase superfamily II) [Haloactinospora alba]|uniref:Glyoxylase-like metal-dependent hydrolase (Beta-lactamase superfamily II) n=1 Tax=Haloactinospora alba TaxID=405555 RepID=A0A543NF77_9ACTN|nr:MBL fold metallo-hydrolase [Haloactinospora alba]TQN30471.1 glyoxylase-like metal-dependent hydrolase (beta-lactamase superfamily II) [Haloactinospora alba]